MAHKAQKIFVQSVKALFPDSFVSKKVLEVGSLNINGTLRGLFEDCDYTGIDLAIGRDVDIACAGQDYDAPDSSFDTCISAECFEHNPYWKETFLNMTRICKPKGLVLFTCATTGRAEHGTSRAKPGNSPFTIKEWDYYKNLTEEDFTSVIQFDDDLFDSYEFSVNTSCYDLYFWGIKK